MACTNSIREEKRKVYNYDSQEPQDTWQELSDHLMSYGDLYFDHKINIANLESRLHDTWDRFIYAATVLPPASPEHDRLITLIISVRELGIFTRKDEDGPEEAKFANGQRLWTDLPYFAQDLQAFWMDESMSLGRGERESLAVFTAKACASGFCSLDVAQCALWLFKEALEMDRLISKSSSPTSQGSETSAHPHVYVSDLIPALVQWMKYSNYKLVIFCAESAYSPGMSIPDLSKTSPGPLARRAQITDDGFNMKRWLFWRQRLGELYLMGDEVVAKSARECFEIMALTGRTVGVNIPGEKQYLEKLFEALDKELIMNRGRQGCVYPKDIEIDPAWVIEG